jgi:hypothetical protein
LSATEFPLLPYLWDMTARHHKSQRQCILDALLAARGRPVPSYELAQLALQYNSRLKELRALGFVIHSHETIASDGVRHTSFALELGISTAISPDVGRNSALPAQSPSRQLTLVGDLAPLPDYPD